MGNTRKGRLLEAARQIAHDVVLVPTAIAIARSTHGSWRVRCIVVEIRSGDVVVSCVQDFDGDVAVVSTARASMAELPEVFAEFEELTVRDSVVVVGHRSHSVASSMERGSRRIHGYKGIRILDESRIVCSLVDPRVRVDTFTAEALAGRTVDNSAFGDQWVPPMELAGASDSTVRVRRWSAAMTAGVVVAGLVAAGMAFVLGRGAVEGTAVQAESSDTPLVDAAQASGLVVTSEPNMSSTNLVPSNPVTSASSVAAVPTAVTALEVGNVSLDLPIGWEPALDRSSAERTDLLPSSGNDRKIVVVQKELREGAEFDAVEAALREQSETLEDPLRFGNFETIELADGRKVLLYREFPDGYSEVRWQVFVEHGIQVSVGCQYLVDEWSTFEFECAQVTDSLSYVN